MFEFRLLTSSALVFYDDGYCNTVGRLLLGYGADPRIVDKEGKSALQYVKDKESELYAMIEKEVTGYKTWEEKIDVLNNKGTPKDEL